MVYSIFYYSQILETQFWWTPRQWRWSGRCRPSWHHNSHIELPKWNLHCLVYLLEFSDTKIVVENLTLVMRRACISSGSFAPLSKEVGGPQLGSSDVHLRHGAPWHRSGHRRPSLSGSSVLLTRKDIAMLGPTHAVAAYGAARVAPFCSNARWSYWHWLTTSVPMAPCACRPPPLSPPMRPH